MLSQICLALIARERPLHVDWTRVLSIVLFNTLQSNFTEQPEQTGLIQRIQQGFPWISPLCMQNAHDGQHRSPSNSHTASRFPWKSCTWLE